MVTVTVECASEGTLYSVRRHMDSTSWRMLERRLEVMQQVLIGKVGFAAVRRFRWSVS